MSFQERSMTRYFHPSVTHHEVLHRRPQLFILKPAECSLRGIYRWVCILPCDVRVDLRPAKWWIKYGKRAASESVWYGSFSLVRQKRQAAESVALFDTGAAGDSVAAAGKRSHQWCLTLTPNDTKTIERMTCRCFLRPIRRELTSSSYTTGWFSSAEPI